MDRNAPKGLLIISLLIGFILFIGTSIYKINNNYKTKDYIETKAIFVEPFYVIGDDMTHLKYVYIVDGISYDYITDYGTSNIPKTGSEITIKYDQNNPNNIYVPFDVLSIFQIIGLFIMFGTLVILFSGWRWLRDILIMICTGSLIIEFITNGFYKGCFIIVLIILSVLCFAAIMEFITELKNKKIHPLSDIKNEILVSKELKDQKKLLKENMTEEDKKIKSKKCNKVIKGIILFIVPFPVFLLICDVFPNINGVVYAIISFITCVCIFFGFCIIGVSLVGFDKNKTIIIVAGKVIENDDIVNKEKMSFKEKFIKFNIIGIILRILGVTSFLGLIVLIASDPFKLFKIFSNPGLSQIIFIIILVIGLDLLFIFFQNKEFSKKSIIVTLIIECILTCYLFYYFFYLV